MSKREWSENGSDRPPSRKERKEISHIFLWAIGLELVLLIVVAFLGISFRFFDPAGELVDVVVENAPLIVGVLVVIIIIKLALDLANFGMNRLVKRYQGVESSARMIWRFISYGVWLLVGIAIILLLFGDVWASMVWVAVIIAALIYSLSTSLQNVAAWFQIIFSQPYKIGDIIEMGDIRGYVVDVSLSSTMVREMGNWVNGDLYTGRFVTIPNRMILEKGVANYTRHNKFIYEYLAVSLTYESDIARGEAVLLDIVREVLGSADVDFVKATKDAETKELVRAMPKKPRVFWQSRDSGVELGVLYMVTMHDRFYMRSEITKRFLSAVKEEPCLSIAYPHVEVVRHEQPDHNKEIA